MTPKLIIAITFIIDFIFNLDADQNRNQKLKILTKPLLVPLIILFYLISATHINWLILAALFCGFIGDISLLWGSIKPLFTLGLLAFLAGHLFYTAAFLQSTEYLSIVPAWVFLLLIPYILYSIFILKLLKPGLKNMVLPVSIYMCAISLMSFSSACRIWNGFTLPNLLPFIGSLSFIASDSVLAYSSFNSPRENYETFIMATYILAQCLITAGFIL